MSETAGEGRRVAIVGAGPSGFYAADQLLAQGFEVDLLDLLPTPFGLVRAGVAPDHPKIKSVTRMYEKTAARDGFRFFGGVALGEDITRAELLERYHAVVYAVGTVDRQPARDPGRGPPRLARGHATSSPGTTATRTPATSEFDLSGDARRRRRQRQRRDRRRAHARARPRRAGADRHRRPRARTRSAAAQVEEVVLLGRRGPAQAAFTNPELRELGELSRADVSSTRRARARRRQPRVAESRGRGDREAQRRDAARLRRAPRSGDASHRIDAALPALARSRSSARARDGQVTGCGSCTTGSSPAPTAACARSPTDREEVIPCGLVMRSIGYRGEPLDDVPFDERRGLIRNTAAACATRTASRCPASTSSGWIKRGPSGVIGTNKKDAADTVARIVEDAEAGRLPEPADADAERIAAWLRDARAGARQVGRLAGDRRARARPRRAGRAARASSS